MRVPLPKLNISAPYFLKQCGYVEIHNRHKDNETSYARSLHVGRFYPRFHIYIDNAGSEIFLNLHLDAKEPSYAGTSAHGGEYEGEIIKNEALRIKRIAGEFSGASTDASKELGFKKQSWWQKLFGL